MYKLVYIKGISRYDTWKFANKTEQYNYFDGLDGVTIDEFYPPHYTNNIKLELSQVDYNAVNFNYLLLSFNDKYYFYFIDKITYINEDVYSLEIVMDTVQTYMFDINFYQSHIFKRSIKRFNDDGTINRNYVRENLSHGDFKYKSLNLIESSIRYIIIYSTVRLGAIQYPSPVAREYLDEQSYVNDNIYNYSSNTYYVYICPILANDFYQQHRTDGYKLNGNGSSHIGTNRLNNLWDMLNDIGSVNGIVDMVMCNNIALDTIFGITYDYGVIQEQTPNSVYGVNFYSSILDVEYGNFGGQTDYSYPLYRLPTLLGINTLKHNINLGCTKNTSLNILKNKKFIPQLLDENYFRIYFGEKSNYNQLPLYKIYKTKVIDTYLNVQIACIFDVMSCARTYWLINDLTSLKDDFLTTIVCNSNEGMVLKNDAWKTYISQNRATWTDGFQLQKDLNASNLILNTAEQGIKAIGSFVGGGITSNFLSPKRAMANVAGTGTTATASYIGGMASSIGNYFIQQHSIDANHRITQGNLLATPQESKQGNNFTNDLNIKANSFMVSVEVVSDIDNVALEYENEGYSVNEIYTDTNIFEFNDRYYYNIIQGKDIRFDLDVLSTNDIKNDIRTRIESGLRLWNKSNNTNILDNIIYDNVETNLLEE